MGKNLYFRAKKKSRATYQRELIKFYLYMADSSPSQVAKIERVTPGAVSRVMAGDLESARIKRRIAEIVKQPVKELWAA